MRHITAKGKIIAVAINMKGMPSTPNQKAAIGAESSLTRPKIQLFPTLYERFPSTMKGVNRSCNTSKKSHKGMNYGMSYIPAHPNIAPGLKWAL